MSSHTQAAATTITRSVVVNAPIERAFEVFTEGIGTWWPAGHHMMGEDAVMVFEPRAGGRIVDRGADGNECAWARVLAYEPPTRVVFTWDISAEWQIETDLSKTSEVEVRFIAETADRTRVELEHRHLERHGLGWEGMREALSSGEGWPLELASYARAV